MLLPAGTSTDATLQCLVAIGAGIIDIQQHLDRHVLRIDDAHFDTVEPGEIPFSVAREDAHAGPGSFGFGGDLQHRARFARDNRGLGLLGVQREGLRIGQVDDERAAEGVFICLLPWRSRRQCAANTPTHN